MAISERNKRRMAKKTVLRKAAAVRSGQIPLLPPRPDQPEVFRLDDDGTGKPIYFDVQALRNWTASNMEASSVRIEEWRAARLIETGAVDQDHIMQHTLHHRPDPIIVCRQAAGLGEDAIVDGAHRYVAAALGAAMMGQTKMGFAAYVLAPEQWRPFMLSPAELAVITASTG